MTNRQFMKRREFIKSSAWLGTAFLAPFTSLGCASASPPLQPLDFPVAPGSRILLKNVRIVDVEDDRIIFPGHILLRDQAIEQISEYSDFPPAELTLDLQGKYAIPGLINGHCHLTLPGAADLGLGFLLAWGRQCERNAEECLRHGVTTVRDMLGFPGKLEEMKKNIASGKMLGPRILRGIGIQVRGGYGLDFALLGGEKMVRAIRSVAEVKEQVSRACEDGADFIKTFLQYTKLWIPTPALPVLSDAELIAIQQEAEKHGKVVAVHHTSVEGFRKNLRAGIQSFEHMPRDQELTDTDVEAFVKSGAGINPTASVAWALSFPRNGDPYADAPEVKQIIEDKKARLPKILDEFAEESIRKTALENYRKLSDPDYFEHWHLMITPEPKIFTAAAVIGSRNLHRLVRAGALVGCGNDGGIPFDFPGAMALEMGILQRSGLPPKDILRMATINNAKIIRMSDRIGSLKKGKLADIVILAENPLADIENLGKVEKVFFEGKLKYST
jgi:imidazolonepropionase-like amidohydrolase